MINKNIKNIQKQHSVLPKKVIEKGLSFSIIIPNYNGSKYLIECLYSLYQAIKFSSAKFEIIIVDNHSSDKSLSVAHDFFNNYHSTKLSGKIISLPQNLGFASAINLGIKQSKYHYIIPCNNDLTLEKNWFQIISKVIQENSDPKIITFFGTVLNKKGDKYESQGLKFYPSGKAKNISNGKKFQKSKIKNLKPALVWGSSAALVIYQKDIIQKVGAFDQDFFAYEEDVDLSLRLTNLGYKTLYIPQAISYHLGGATSNQMGNFRSRMDFKNWHFIIIKNYSLKKIVKNFPQILKERCRNLSYLSKTTIEVYRFKSLYLLPKDLIKTYLQIITKIPNILKKRKEIKKLIKSTKSKQK